MISQKELEATIKYHQTLYYNGHEAISDAEFDELWNMLEEYYPESSLFTTVGEDIVKGSKLKHKILMGSQRKISSLVDLDKWLLDIQFPVIVQPKWDGNSVEIQYEEGILSCAVTRGNAVEGEDITRAIILNGKIPLKLNSNFTGAVRGEIILDRATFEAKYSEFKNPRNFTAGALKNESFTEYQDFNIYIYDILNDYLDYETEEEKLLALKNLDLPVSKHWRVKSFDEIRKIYCDLNPKYFPENIDGLVLKQSLIDPKDLKEIRPKKQVALKWKNDGEETVFLGIECSRTGTTYTPVAILEPVEIEGTTVKRASLSNLDGINKLQLKIGDTVGVVKRGEIIPKVECVIDHTGTQDIDIITKCEVCGSDLTITPTKIFCSNPDCKGVFEHRLAKWLSVLDVKEFGPSLQNYCISNDNITSIKDLYNEDKSTFIMETYGSINAKKAFNNLYNTKVNLASAIAGFDIEGIGLEIAKSIIDEGYNSFEKIDGLTLDKLVTIKGWSDIRAAAFLEGWKAVREELKDLVDANIVNQVEEVDINTVESAITGKKFCITGKLNTCTRNEMEKMLVSRGAILDKSVSKSTDYLVTNDTSSGSSKLKNAAKFNTKIISEEEFLLMLS